MAVSKSAQVNCQEKWIGRRRKLSRYAYVILSNDTIKEQDERRLFSQENTELCCYWKSVKLRREANCYGRIFTNGPPVKFSKRCGTTEGCDHKSSSVTSRIPAHSRKEWSTAWFLPVQAQVVWGIRVSRYKVYSEQVMSHGTVILLTPLERSGYRFTTVLSRRQDMQKPWRAY